MPKETIEILKYLEKNGLTDEEFRIVHHMTNNTIKAHRGYCNKIHEFIGEESNNTKVRKRLKIMESALRCAGFSLPPKPGVLRSLAEAAVAEVPKD